MNSLISAPRGGFNLYGLLIGLGIVIAATIAHFVNKNKKLYYDDLVFDMVIAAVPLAVVGARVYFIIFDTVENGYMGFAQMFKVWEGGLAIYGAIIGAMIGIVIVYFIRRNNPEKKVSVIQMFDLGAPFLILGQAIGRWGNFWNQEAYGQKIEGGSFFPIGVYIENGVQGTGWYQATFFYESMWDFLGFAIMLWFYISKKRQSFDGFVFACYGIFYGIGRVIIEGIRLDSMWLVPPSGNFAGIRISQVVSIIFILAGLGIILFHIYRARKNNKKIYILTPLEKLSEEYYGVNPKLLRQIRDPEGYELELSARREKDKAVLKGNTPKKKITGDTSGDLTEEEKREIELEVSRELHGKPEVKKTAVRQADAFVDGFEDDINTKQKKDKTNNEKTPE